MTLPHQMHRILQTAQIVLNLQVKIQLLRQMRRQLLAPELVVVKEVVKTMI